MTLETLKTDAIQLFHNLLLVQWAAYGPRGVVCPCLPEMMDTDNNWAVIRRSVCYVI